MNTHNKQEKLFKALGTYDLTPIVHAFDKEAINTLFHGKSLLSYFLDDIFQKINNNNYSYITKFIGIYTQLITLGANVNLSNEDTGNTLLHDIIIKGTNNTNQSLFTIILNSSNINKKNYKEESPLDIAFKYDNEIAISNIFNHKDLKLTEHNIIEITKYCHNAIILESICSNENFNLSMIHDKDKSNLLLLAIKNNNTDIIPFLIEKNINPFKKNWEHKNCLDYITEDFENKTQISKYINFFKLNSELDFNNIKHKIHKI